LAANVRVCIMCLFVCQTFGVERSTLVIGRRTNIRGNDKLGRYRPYDIAQLSKNGRPYMFSAEDYFITSVQGYPWHKVPRDVIVGKVGYDNFLVLNALRHNVSVVDATNTLLAMHQTGGDGNLAGHHGSHGSYNMRLLGRFNFRGGLTSSSQYVTKLINDTDNDVLGVEIETRPKRNQTRFAPPRTRNQQPAGSVGRETTKNLTDTSTTSVLPRRKRPPSR